LASNEPILSGLNMGFRTGMGLIETMLLRDGAIRFIAQHMARLYNSARKLGFKFLVEKEQLMLELYRTIDHTQHPENGIVRIQIFPNSGDDQISFIINCVPLDLPVYVKGDNALTVGVATKVLKCFDSVAYLKTSCRQPYIVAKNEAIENNWDDALLINQYGRIVESTIANVFIVQGSHVLTPPLTEGCIEGIMRNEILLMNTSSAWKVLQKEISIEDLMNADEVFLTNAVRGIQPVINVKDRNYKIDVSLQIEAAINQY